MSGNEILKKQLEHSRFLRALEYVQKDARGTKKLISSELLHLNQIINNVTGPTWRSQSTKVKIPGGIEKQFSIINNPIVRARDILTESHALLQRDEISRAATHLYTTLIKDHLFSDANRRTAVLAVVWLLLERNIEINAQELHDIPLGDISDPNNMTTIENRINELILRNQNSSKG